ncbi:MAG TPA: CDP-alcohol phosphatidyltransferase family protein [Candidatus Binatia bacterium]
MTTYESTNSPSLLRLAACWAVHFYTASGALTAFASLHAIFHDDLRAAFLWLYVAVVIDSTDGMLARLAGVKRYLPYFDGAKLDDIVDYLTFVVVPIVLMVQIGTLASTLGLFAACAALLASAYRFCHADAKTPDHYFTGFPSYWNIVALYLWVFDAPPEVSAWIVVVLAVLVFVPLRFIYPSRMTVLRKPTIVLGVVWAVMVAVVLLRVPTRSAWLAALSMFYPAYYTLLSFYLQWRGR